MFQKFCRFCVKKCWRLPYFMAPKFCFMRNYCTALPKTKCFFRRPKSRFWSQYLPFSLARSPRATRPALLVVIRGSTPLGLGAAARVSEMSEALKLFWTKLRVRRIARYASDLSQVAAVRAWNIEIGRTRGG